MDVVLLHGLGADTHAFDRFERRLPNAWNIVKLDLLGHGEADKPESGYGLEDHAAYIGRRIAKADLVQPIIVGHSYGAAVGVVLAATEPHAVRALVLLDPIEYDPSRGSRTEQMIQARRDNRMAEVVEDIFGNDSPAHQRWIVDTWNTMAVGVVNEIDHDWMRYAPQVRCPVAVIHGETAQGGGGPAPARNFDATQVSQIDGAGHYLHATHARQTADAVIAAVERLTARA